MLHRPPGDAIGIDGKTSPDHYWWLIPEWSNWYLASGHVAALKRRQFPVIGERAKVPNISTIAQNRLSEPDEISLFLDPCSPNASDDPVWHLSFDEKGRVAARDIHRGCILSGRNLSRRSKSPGDQTIRILDLNHKYLVESRHSKVNIPVRILHSAIHDLGNKSIDLASAVQKLETAISKEVPFSAAKRQVVARRFLKLLRDRRFQKNGPNNAGLRRLSGRIVSELQSELAAIIYCETEYKLTSEEKEVLASIDRHFHEVFPHLALWEQPPIRIAKKSFRRKPFQTKKAAVKKKAGPVKILPSQLDQHETEQPIVGVSDSIQKITIRNFKAIHDVQLGEEKFGPIRLESEYGTQLAESLSGHRWWALLGENGSGKTCILQAIALALSGESINEVMEEAKLEWKNLIRRPNPGSVDKVLQGRICLEFPDGLRIDLRFNHQKHWWVRNPTGIDARDGKLASSSQAYSSIPKIETFVRAYGATRLLQSGESTDARRIRVANLFDPRAEVSDAKSWLLSEISDEEFNIAAPVIARLIGQDDFGVSKGIERGKEKYKNSTEKILKRNRRKGEVTIDGIPLEMVSDGYRAVIAMICDIMRGLGKNLSSMQNANGIVLIDEIGAHLHPRWRMSITGKLRRALPSIQFIVSTHEPLCLRGLQEREVVLVKKERKGVSTEIIDRNPSFLRVDQLLTSECFGLNTTIDPELDRRFQHYYQLLAIPEEDRGIEQQKEFESLHRYIREHAKPSLGNSRRDQVLYEQIDQYLAEEFKETFGKDRRDTSREEFIKNRQTRRKNALKLVKDIWKHRRAIQDIGEIGGS